MKDIWTQLANALSERALAAFRQQEDELYAFVHLPKELQEVARYLSEGWGDKEIAHILKKSLADIREARLQLLQYYRAPYSAAN